jgi:hypothetical protein
MQQKSTPLLKDSELKEFFKNNYDTRPGRNDKKLEQILNLSEGSNEKVFLRQRRKVFDNVYLDNNNEDQYFEF